MAGLPARRSEHRLPDRTDVPLVFAPRCAAAHRPV